MIGHMGGSFRKILLLITVGHGGLLVVDIRACLCLHILIKMLRFSGYMNCIRSFARLTIEDMIGMIMALEKVGSSTLV